LPAYILVLALVLDFLHYGVATVVCRSYQLYNELKGTKETDTFTAPLN
jgi:hypothetical protein